MRTKKLNLDRSVMTSKYLDTFGQKIQESAELALKKLNHKADKSASGIIEESVTEDTINSLFEGSVVKHDPDFIFKAADKSKKLMKIEESRAFISTDKYSEKLLKNKLKHDYSYLKTFEESFKFEDTKKTFDKLVTESLVICADLYKETNTTPRLISHAIEDELTESENIEIYKNIFKHTIEESFRRPMLEGTLIEENIEPVKKIIKISIDKGMNDLGDINPEELGTVLGFNNTLSGHLKDVLLPEGAQNKINAFIDSQDNDYKTIDGNAEELLNKLNEKIDNLTVLLSGPQFEKNVEMSDDSEPIDAGKYSAITKICSITDNDDEETGGCKTKVVPDAGDVDNTEFVEEAEKLENKDNDGIKDSKEDHEEAEKLENKDNDGIKDSKEDHEEAEKLEDKDNDGIKNSKEDQEEAEKLENKLDVDPEAAMDEVKDDLDAEVMDALELHDGEDIAKEDIEAAEGISPTDDNIDDAVINPNKPEELEDKELIENKEI